MVDIRVFSDCTILADGFIELVIFEERFGEINSEELSLDTGEQEYTLTNTDFGGGGEYWMEIELEGDDTELDSITLDYLEDEHYETRELKDESSGTDELSDYHSEGLSVTDIGSGVEEKTTHENSEYQAINTKAIIPKGTAIDLKILTEENEQNITLTDGGQEYGFDAEFDAGRDYWLEAELVSDVEGLTPELDTVNIVTLVEFIIKEDKAISSDELEFISEPLIPEPDTAMGIEKEVSHENSEIVHLETKSDIPYKTMIDLRVLSEDYEHELSITEGNKKYPLPKRFEEREQLKNEFWTEIELISDEEGETPELDRLVIYSTLKILEDIAEAEDEEEIRVKIELLDSVLGVDSAENYLSLVLKEDLELSEDDRVTEPIIFEVEDSYDTANINDLVDTVIPISKEVLDSFDGLEEALDYRACITKFLEETLNLNSDVSVRESETVEESESVSIVEDDYISELISATEKDQLEFEETAYVREAVTRIIEEELNLDTDKYVSELVTVIQTDGVTFEDDAFVSVLISVEEEDKVEFEDSVHIPIERELKDQLALADYVKLPIWLDVKDQLALADYVKLPIWLDVKDQLALAESTEKSEEYECVIDDGGTHYLSDLTPMACVKVVVTGGSTLIIDEPWRKQILRIGRGGEEGHIRFTGDYSYDEPTITFSGINWSGFIFDKGSVGLYEEDMSWGELFEREKRIVIACEIEEWEVQTEEYFSQDDFDLKGIEHIELYDLQPILSFVDEDGDYQDLELDKITSYSTSLDLSLSSTSIERGSSSWSSFRGSEGKIIGLEASHDREDKDRWLEVLERIASVNQRYNDLFLSSRGYLGWGLIEGISEEVSNPRLANYSIDFGRKIKEDNRLYSEVEEGDKVVYGEGVEEQVIGGGGTYSLGDIDVEEEKLVITNDSTLIIDESLDIRIIRLGRDGESGHLEFKGDYDKNSPAINFIGDQYRGLVLDKGSIGVGLDKTWGERQTDEDRIVITSSKRSWEITTAENFSPFDFRLENVNDIELYDLHPRLSFEDITGLFRDIKLDPIISYESTIEIRIRHLEIEGGTSMNRKFDRSEGKEFSLSASHNRRLGDKFVQKLERVGEMRQLHSPLLLSSRNYFGYCLIGGIDSSVSPASAHYDLELIGIDEGLI